MMKSQVAAVLTALAISLSASCHNDTPSIPSKMMGLGIKALSAPASSSLIVPPQQMPSPVWTSAIALDLPSVTPAIIPSPTSVVAEPITEPSPIVKNDEEEPAAAPEEKAPPKEEIEEEDEVEVELAELEESAEDYLLGGTSAPRVELAMDDRLLIGLAPADPRAKTKRQTTVTASIKETKMRVANAKD